MVHLFSSSELTQLCHRNIDWWLFCKLKSLLRRYVILSRGTVSRPGRGALFIYLFVYLFIYLFIYLILTVYGQRPKDNL